MKSTTLSLISILLGATSILSAAPQETPKTVYAKIAALLNDGHADKVVPLMTKAAHKEMVDGMIEDAAEAYLFNREDAKPLPDGTKPTGADLGFDTFEFPKWFANRGELPEEGFSMADFRKKLRALMDTVPDRKRALNSLQSYSAAVNPKGIFNGKIIDPPEGHEKAPGILWVSFEEIYGTFNEPLRFEKQDNGELLYAGYAWDIIQAEKDKFVERKNLTITGESVDDEKLSLKDLKGKVVLVDFWGTWCGPCIKSLPQLKEIKEAYKQHGFEILGVASDQKKAVSKFFVENGPLPWPNIIDPENEIVDKLKIEAFPTYFLIDKSGKHIATPRDRDELGGLIAGLLGIDPIPLGKAYKKEAK